MYIIIHISICLSIYLSIYLYLSLSLPLSLSLYIYIYKCIGISTPCSGARSPGPPDSGVGRPRPVPNIQKRILVLGPRFRGPKIYHFYILLPRPRPWDYYYYHYNYNYYYQDCYTITILLLHQDYYTILIRTIILLLLSVAKDDPSLGPHHDNKY